MSLIARQSMLPTTNRSNNSYRPMHMRGVILPFFFCVSIGLTP